MGGADRAVPRGLVVGLVEEAFSFVGLAEQCMGAGLLLCCYSEYGR